MRQWVDGRFKVLLSHFFSFSIFIFRYLMDFWFHHTTEELHKHWLSCCVHRSNMNSNMKAFPPWLGYHLRCRKRPGNHHLMSLVHPHPPFLVALQFKFSFAHSIQWQKFVCPHKWVWGFTAPTHNFSHSSTHFTAEFQDITSELVAIWHHNKINYCIFKVFKNLLKNMWLLLESQPA